MFQGNRRKYINRMKEKFSLTWDGSSSSLGNLRDLNKEFVPLMLLHKYKELKNICRKNTPVSVMTKQAHIIDMSELFGSDERKYVPQTVVLCGGAGIGKTILTRKIMLDWAEGDLFQDRFKNVIYVNCKTVNLTLEMTLVDLISKDWPDLQAPIEAIMSNPKQLLFIIDGFDEVKWPFVEPEPELCHHWKEKCPVPVLLRSLLWKTIFPRSSLLIATRSSALMRFRCLIDDPNCVEVLGFTEANIEMYISKFFKSEAKVLKVLDLLKVSDTLSEKCSVPLECWIICTCLKQQMERGEVPVLLPQTTTDLYVSYLSFGLSHDGSSSSQHHDLQLRRLCSLAAEEVWAGKFTFNEDDLKRHGLDVSDDSFLNMYILEKKDKENCYSFIHGRFLEFFAAMFYVLEEKREERDYPAFAVKDVIELLVQTRESDSEVSIMNFLFGLLNEETMRQLDRNFVYPTIQRGKAELLQWMILESNIQRMINPLLHPDPLELFQCLYEIRQEELVRKTMKYFQSMRLNLHTSKDILVSIFCIKLCYNLVNIHLHISRTLMYNSPHILIQWKELISVLLFKKSLIELELSGSFPDDRLMKIVYKEIMHPNCKLHTLRFHQVELSEEMKKEFENLPKMKNFLYVFFMWKNVEIIPDSEMKEEEYENSPQDHQRFEPEEVTPQTEAEVTSLLASFDPLKEEQLDLEKCLFLGPNGPVEPEWIDKKRNIYKVRLSMAGFYHCPYTGLGFDVRSEVTVDIEFGTWNQHLDWIQQQSWMIAGPLFHITVDPGVVTSVHLPHFVHLQGGKVDISLFKIAHFKEEGMVLENPTRMESSHAILENPSFSPMGVLLRIVHSTFRFIPIYSTTLIYFRLRAEDITLHLYLIPSDCTIRKAIDEEEAKFHFLRLHKPSPVTPLYIGSRFLVSGSKHLEIMPTELELCYQSAGECQFFSEIYTSNVKEIISLDLRDPKGTVVWGTLVRSGDVGTVCAPISPATTELHFVDQHRNQIISRVTSVDIILDRLHSQFLSNEDYEHIRAEKTNPEKMRRLFSFSPSWSKDYKDHLYRVLREIHPHLMNELEHMEKILVRK
ncbi:NACHT, LRR and PYD domains-containing protein 1 [Monodelphis domestica]|uniref:NACHT, LRR and PYD domains-containing protein 1 n=1 Tax=Monodelphis domestica TaxID=13616 RepID=UPI0024E19DCE|nr:NACHT, LRR and PYD domains-containing protein 1 [Monodelphis domestica]